MTKDEAMQIALNALVWNLPIVEDFGDKDQLKKQHKSIEALRTALARPEPEPEPEPVAWMRVEDLKAFQESGYTESASVLSKPFGSCDSAPLYAAPPQRKPLTDVQIDDIVSQDQWTCDVESPNWKAAFIRITRAIEAAHGIKD